MKVKERICPRCASNQVMTERGINGKSHCMNCGFSDLTFEFDKPLKLVPEPPSDVIVGLSREQLVSVSEHLRKVEQAMWVSIRRHWGEVGERMVAVDVEATTRNFVKG